MATNLDVLPRNRFHCAARQNVANAKKHKGAVHVNENHKSHGVGGYEVKNKDNGKPSPHATGRAAESYFEIENPLLRAIGDEMFAGFAAHARQLGIEEVIWNRKIWSRDCPAIHP